MTQRPSVFVTGGAGFIGTALMERMTGIYQAWTIYDSLLPQVHGAKPVCPEGPNLNFIKGDIRDLALLTETILHSEPEIVIHLASETGTGQSAYEPELHTEVNVTGTANLINALSKLETKPRKVVLTSSRAVYGEGPWKNESEEIWHPLGRSTAQLLNGIWDYPGSSPVDAVAGVTIPTPCNVYGVTKLAQEHLLSSWCAANGVSLSILRLQNVYGPGQSPINPYTGVTNFFFNRSRTGEAIPVFEDGQIYRDFVYIADVVQALVTAMHLENDCLVDVGSGIKNTILHLADIVTALTEGKQPKITGEFRTGDVRHAGCDMATSRWIFNGQEPTLLEVGIEKLNDWLLSQSTFKL